MIFFSHLFLLKYVLYWGFTSISDNTTFPMVSKRHHLLSSLILNVCMSMLYEIYLHFWEWHGYLIHLILNKINLINFSNQQYIFEWLNMKASTFTMPVPAGSILSIRVLAPNHLWRSHSSLSNIFTLPPPLNARHRKLSLKKTTGSITLIVGGLWQNPKFIKIHM